MLRLTRQQSSSARANDPARCDQALEQQEMELLRIEGEVLLVLQLYWHYHYEGLVMPGAEDAPVLRFFPPELVRRLNPNARQHPQEQAPQPNPDLPPQQPPELPAHVQPVAGLIELPPDHPVWDHPRIAFFRELGSKKIFGTRFFGREDYFAIPIMARSGTILVVLESLHEGHTAAYFFRAGRPGDSPEQLLAWLEPAQWTRKKVRNRSTRPPQYVDRIFHYKKGRRQQNNPAPGDILRWQMAVRRLLDSN
jgi:hypothetical protein